MKDPFDVGPTSSSVEVWLTAKIGKTSTVVANRKLSRREDAERRKASWDGRLTALKTSLEARG